MTKAKFVDLEDELHARAAEMAQYSDFGPPVYRTGLRLLLRAFDQDATFTEVGFHFAYGTVLGTLVARLYAQRGFADSPPEHAPPIRAPLVITGIPRTGTTALHKLLSMDPQFQGLEHWLTDYPMIRPPRSTWPANPAFQASVAGLDAFFAAMPQMRKAHDMVADEVGECLDILRQSFVSNRFGSAIHVPSYDDWFFAQSEIPSYHRYADVLRLIGTAEPQKRWLLKNPGHIAQLEALFAVFPDALVIHTHRDPVAAIPSLCSTLYMARAMYEGDHTERRVIGPRECRYWRTALDSAATARTQRESQFIDIDHRRFHRDPMSTVRSIYEKFGLALSPTAEARMCDWVRADPTTKHGEHRYDIESWGITEASIRSTFSQYREMRAYT